MEIDECGDASSHVGDIADFIGCEPASEECFFAVRQPFFDDLIAADAVFPDGGGDVLPAGDVVKEDIAGSVVVVVELAFTGHGDAAFAGVAPAGGEVEIAGGEIYRLTVRAGEDRDRLELFGYFAGGDAGGGRFGVQQCRDLSSQRGGGGEDFRVWGRGIRGQSWRTPSACSRR